MKLFDILKQQGLFSNDIKNRIKNNQISINGEIVKADLDLNIRTVADDARVLVENLAIIDNSIIAISFNKLGSKINNIPKHLIEEIEDVFSKLNINTSELLKINVGEIKEILNDFLSQKINIAVIKESGDFICELGKINPIFMTQLKLFGFENLFDSNIKNDLTDILNKFILIKLSKKDSIILKKT